MGRTILTSALQNGWKWEWGPHLPCRRQIHCVIIPFLSFSFGSEERNRWHLETKEYSGTGSKRESLNPIPSQPFKREAELTWGPGSSPGISVGFHLTTHWNLKGISSDPSGSTGCLHLGSSQPASHMERAHGMKKVGPGGGDTQSCLTDAMYRWCHNTVRQLQRLINKLQPPSFRGTEKICVRENPTSYVSLENKGRSMGWFLWWQIYHRVILPGRGGLAISGLSGRDWIPETYQGSQGKKMGGISKTSSLSETCPPRGPGARNPVDSAKI